MYGLTSSNILTTQIEDWFLRNKEGEIEKKEDSKIGTEMEATAYMENNWTKSLAVSLLLLLVSY